MKVRFTFLYRVSAVSTCGHLEILATGVFSHILALPCSERLLFTEMVPLCRDACSPESLQTSGASGLWDGWEETEGEGGLGGGADLPPISPAPPPSFPPAALESVPWPSDEVLTKHDSSAFSVKEVPTE